VWLVVCVAGCVCVVGCVCVAGCVCVVGGVCAGVGCASVWYMEEGKHRLTACKTFPILSPSTRSKGTAVMSMQEILAAFPQR